MSSVVVRDLVKTYGALAAVDHVSFEVEQGEFFFLLGPSGCGKTTLLRAIAGFVRPDSGVIRIADHDITDVPPHRRDTAMVFQNYALWPHMNARDNVRYGLNLRPMSKAEREQRTTEALDLVRMSDHAHKRPAQLSGGQQQRVALARAVAVRPQVLLLDEPLSNLDAKLRQDMRNELRRIHAVTGVTAIYVTHDQKEALSMAERMAVMDRGKIAQIGSPKDLYRRPRTAFVAEFLGQTNFLHGRILHAAQEGCLLIDTPIGKILSSPPSTDSRDRNVRLSIRPESFLLGPPPEGARTASKVQGRVEEVTYLGDQQEYVIAAEGREPMTLRVAAANPGLGAPKAGDAVALHFDAEDVVILPE